MATPYYLYPYTLAQEEAEELETAKTIFGKKAVGTVVHTIPPRSLVIPRYRSLPFGRELEEEVAAVGSVLVNSWRQHCAVADIFAWCHLLEGLTPPCYTVEDIPQLPEGAYFLKGETNSLKNSWFTSSFAPSKANLLPVVQRLQEDLWTGNQRIALRPFQEYRRLGTQVDGRPLFHERRAFVYRGQVLTDAWYWSSWRDAFPQDPTLSRAAFEETLQKAVARIGHIAPFLTVDLAEYPDGSWGVVELNSGPMAGLSDNDPQVLWRNFLRVEQGKKPLSYPLWDPSPILKMDSQHLHRGKP